MYLKGRFRESERDLPFAGLCPEWLHGWDWARQETGTWNSVPVCHVGDRELGVWSIFLCFPKCIYKELQAGVEQTGLKLLLIWDVGTAGGALSCATVSAPSRFYTERVLRKLMKSTYFEKSLHRFQVFFYIHQKKHIFNSDVFPLNIYLFIIIILWYS